MKPVLILSLGVLALLLVAPAPTAQAACPPPPSTSPLAVGELGIFLDAAGTQRCREDIPPFIDIRVYLVAHVPAGGLNRFDLPEIAFDLSLPPGVMFTGGPHVVAPGYVHGVVSDACDFGLPAQGDPCPSGQDGGIIALATYTYMALASPSDSWTVCISPMCTDAWTPYPLEPAFSTCGSTRETPFVVHYERCVWLGPQVVPNGQGSWGVLKASFSRD